jgi:hypothetical protein
MSRKMKGLGAERPTLPGLNEQPWLGVRRHVIARWARSFGHKRRDDRDELFAYVLGQIAENFTPKRIREEPGRVVEFAKTVVKREIAEVVGGRVRARSGANALTNDPHLVETYAESPIETDDDNGREIEAEGTCPFRAISVDAVTFSPAYEDELLAAIDARRFAPDPGADEIEDADLGIVLTAPFELESFWAEVDAWVAGQRFKRGMQARFPRHVTPREASQWHERDRFGNSRITATEATLDCLASGYRPDIEIRTTTTPKHVFDAVFSTIDKAFSRKDSAWLEEKKKKIVPCPVRKAGFRDFICRGVENDGRANGDCGVPFGV